MKPACKLIILCSFLMIGLNSYSQINNSDSLLLEQSFKSKLRLSFGLGISNLEQKVTGPATNVTSNLNVLNIGFYTNYKIREGLFIEAGIASLIGSSFNYYYENVNSLSNLKNYNSNFQRPINTSFSLVNTSINLNASIFRKKPNALFFIPDYVFLGPRYDAIIGGGSLKYNNNLGYQYGIKYKLGLKYSNIYPVLSISQTPNIYKSGRPIITDITNRYIGFSLFIESKEGIKKFKKYTPSSNLKFIDIPLFRWLKKS